MRQRAGSTARVTGTCAPAHADVTSASSAAIVSTSTGWTLTSDPGVRNSSASSSVTARRSSLTSRRSFLLILDDVHLLRNAECRDALSVLADHVPPGSRLVLAGRVTVAMVSFESASRKSQHDGISGIRTNSVTTQERGSGRTTASKQPAWCLATDRPR